jgi:hypothetical protein
MPVHRRNSPLDEAAEHSFELRDVPEVEMKDLTVHEEVIVQENTTQQLAMESFSVENINLASQPLTTGYLNDFFHHKNDIFEKPNHADHLHSPDNILQTARDNPNNFSFEERLVTEEYLVNQLNFNKHYDDSLNTSHNDLGRLDSFSQDILPRQPTKPVAVKSFARRRWLRWHQVLKLMEVTLSMLCMLSCLAVIFLQGTGFRATLIILFGVKYLASIAWCLVVRQRYFTQFQHLARLLNPKTPFSSFSGSSMEAVI